MTSFNFSTWPPQLTPEQLEALTLAATTYALSHGLLYLPPSQSQSNTQPSIPTTAIHAPLSLIPAPFPRAQFQAARELQSVYNVLYARVAMDTTFLDTVMGAEAGVGKADEFTGTLWRGWKKIREHGVLAQSLHLGLFRSDYLLHAAEDRLALKQVEFNTISSSFGPLSERAAAMHRNILASTSYFSVSPHLTADNFPENSTTSGLAEGLSKAHEAYGVRDARILFVVQPNERNVFDQRWLEYELLEKHQIHVVRQTLTDLAVSASLDPSTHALTITLPIQTNPSHEISTIYFRASYTPSDFLTPSHYDTRFLLERSRAIKCPSLPLQLAGGKKVQEALTRPGVLERFLSNEGAKWGTHALDLTAHAAGIRATWMGMWALDSEDAEIAAALDSLPASGQGQGQEQEQGNVPPGTRLARRKAPSLVLKPQREGGGNNVYREAIPAFLDALPAEEREAWIAMEMIETPRGVSGYLVRASPSSAGADSGSTEKKVVRAEVISELGIFGYALFGEGEVVEREVGWLVRTKGTESNEGGVAAGFSVLDSVVLV